MSDVIMNEKESIFLFGLPGSGKSFWCENFINGNLGYEVVSADQIRINHPVYNPDNPESIHEECVALAEKKMYKIAETGQNVIMDGGGINNSYTLRIINRMKDFRYKIKVVFIDTPVHICIERNNQRIKNGERFVPNESIIDKSYRLNKSLIKLQEVCDEFIKIPYFTNEYVFVDMDGTLCEYKNLPVDDDGDVNFVGYEVFLSSKPVYPVINIVNKLQSLDNKNVFIISASPNNICNNEKLEWLCINCNFIKKENVYFVGNKNFKHTFLKHLMLKLKIKPNQCLVIDDDHRILELYKSIGVNTIHPSSLIASNINQF